MTALSLWRGMVPSPRPRMDRIMADLCEAYGISEADMKGPRRHRSISWIRQAYCYEAYATGWFSMPQIGQTINRDHTTVLHGIRVYAKRNGLPNILSNKDVGECGQPEDCSSEGAILPA